MKKIHYITYKTGIENKKIIFEFLKDLRPIFTQTSFANYLNFFVFKIERKISFTDSTIIYDALKYNLEIITLDKQLKNYFLELKNNQQGISL